MSEIINGASINVQLGTKDLSSKPAVYEEAPTPIHQPLFISFAKTGPTTLEDVYGGTAILNYGADTFNPNSKYATHVTPFVKLALSNSNKISFLRVLPDDVGPKANARLSIEIMEKQLNKVKREDDGSFKLKDTSTGELDEDTSVQVDGAVVRFVWEHIEPKEINDPTDSTGVRKIKESQVGKGTQGAGTLTDSSSTASKKYPLIDFEVHFEGSDGNNSGIKIWAPTSKDRNPLKKSILTKDKAYPFRMSLIRKVDGTVTPNVISNEYGENFTDFVLKPGLIDTDFNMERYITDIVEYQYNVLNPLPGRSKKYGPFAYTYTYDDNIKEVLKLLATKEKVDDYIHNDLKDVDVDSDDVYKVNLFGLQNSDGNPYQTIRFAKDSQAGARFTEYSNFYTLGGSDGTMTQENLEAKVRAFMQDIGNQDSPYNDDITFPFSAFWDSGFTMETKKTLGNFISHRKDTMLFLTTFISGEGKLSKSEESSRGKFLADYVRMYTESEFFGTKTVRGVVSTQSGKAINATLKGRAPLAYDLFKKISNFSGGTEFDGNLRIDRVPNNHVTELTDINALFAPVSVRNKDWDNGLLIAERFSTDRVYYPAMRTVHPNDTSVLTSIPLALAICEIQKVCSRAHKQVSGANISQPELKRVVEQYVTDNTISRFADFFYIRPEVRFTTADKNRGYSWTLVVHVSGSMMRTVQTVWIETFDVDNVPANQRGYVA